MECKSRIKDSTLEYNPDNLCADCKHNMGPTGGCFLNFLQSFKKAERR
jgi:hypothetical protein